MTEASAIPGSRDRGGVLPKVLLDREELSVSCSARYSAGLRIRRMRRLGVVVVEPPAQLGQDRLGIP
jgi:hypothetical protein